MYLLKLFLYTVIAKTSAVHLSALSTVIGRTACYVAKVPMIILPGNYSTQQVGTSRASSVTSYVTLLLFT